MKCKYFIYSIFSLNAHFGHIQEFDLLIRRAMDFSIKVESLMTIIKMCFRVFFLPGYMYRCFLSVKVFFILHGHIGYTLGPETINQCPI